MEGLDSAAAALAANASAPTACPWHQFWESAAHPAAWHAIASVARQHAADNLMYTTAVTAVVVPVLGMMCQKQGRRLLFQAADTAVATVLLILLLGVVLGLPVAAAYLLWVSAKTLASYPLAWIQRRR